MELLSRIIITLWKADLWFCEFCKCEISRVRGDYPFTALAGVTIRIIRCWIKEFRCEHHYDNMIQYASYCIFNKVTWFRGSKIAGVLTHSAKNSRKFIFDDCCLQRFVCKYDWCSYSMVHTVWKIVNDLACTLINKNVKR